MEPPGEGKGTVAPARPEGSSTDVLDPDLVRWAMVRHDWEPLPEQSDALGPSINFDWWRCRKCGVHMTTGKDAWGGDGATPSPPKDDEVLQQRVLLDCDESLVRMVLEC